MPGVRPDSIGPVWWVTACRTSSNVVTAGGADFSPDASVEPSVGWSRPSAGSTVAVAPAPDPGADEESSVVSDTPTMVPAHLDAAAGAAPAARRGAARGARHARAPVYIRRDARPPRQPVDGRTARDGSPPGARRRPRRARRRAGRAAVRAAGQGVGGRRPLAPLPGRLGPIGRAGPGPGRGLRGVSRRLPPGPRPPPPGWLAGQRVRPLVAGAQPRVPALARRAPRRRSSDRRAGRGAALRRIP